MFPGALTLSPLCLFQEFTSVFHASLTNIKKVPWAQLFSSKATIYLYTPFFPEAEEPSNK